MRMARAVTSTMPSPFLIACFFPPTFGYLLFGDMIGQAAVPKV